jgi:hypothetical protein
MLGPFSLDMMFSRRRILPNHHDPAAHRSL